MTSGTLAGLQWRVQSGNIGALFIARAGQGDMLSVNSGMSIGWSNNPSNAHVTGTHDLRLWRDGAGTLAQRNGTNAQTSLIYGTYTDASNYRRLSLNMSAAGVAQIVAEGAGTGSAGNELQLPSNTTFSSASLTRTNLGSQATGDLLFTAASPAAAMETLGVIRRVTTTSYMSSSMTLEPAPELTFPVEAGKTYRVDLALIVSSLNAVGGVQVAMSYPALSRTGFGWAQTQLHATSKFPTLGASSVNLNTNTTGVPNGSTGLNGWVYLRPTSSGDVTFAAGQFSAGTGTVGILAESIITVTEL